MIHREGYYYVGNFNLSSGSFINLYLTGQINILSIVGTIELFPRIYPFFNDSYLIKCTFGKRYFRRNGVAVSKERPCEIIFDNLPTWFLRKLIKDNKNPAN
jgi:fucose 4-O-acetylase-like acetyltransferase